MSDTVTQFLHACEHGLSQQIGVLRERLLPEEKAVCCTQGALMAARRHHWETVEILREDIDVGEQECKLVHLALLDHNQMLAQNLISHMSSSAVPNFLWEAAPVIFKHDAAEVFRALLNKLDGRLANPASLALSALKANAFACLNILEAQCFQSSNGVSPRPISQALSSFITTLSFRNEQEGRVLSQYWENYSNWKEKQLLLKSLNEDKEKPTLASRARKI